MPVVISLLRAVNLAGSRKVGMDDLRALYDSLGLKDARTCLNSGNVVFRTSRRDLAALPAQISGRLLEEFGFRTEVIHRTVSEWRDAVARNPFAGRPEIEPGKLLVAFLAGAPDPEANATLMRYDRGPEEIHLSGRELYTYYPNGVGRSKLTAAFVEKALKTPGTGRNWNTVLKLLALAEEIEGH